MKVVMLISTYNHVDLLKKTLAYLDDLDPQPTKYVFSENNSEDEALQVIAEWQQTHPTEIIRLWFRKNAAQILGNRYGIIANIHQILLNRARKMDVDYAIFMANDVFIPYSDFITRITSWKKDLVGVAVPVFRLGKGLCLSPTWINNGPERESKPQILKTVCDGFQEVYSVGGAGMCISRKLLMDKRVNFLPLLKKPQAYSEDIGYCFKARSYGYKCYVDCSLFLGHYVEAQRKNIWKEGFQFGGVPYEKGVVLMPEDYMRVLAEIDCLM